MADIHLPDVQDLYLQHKTLMRAGGQSHFSSLWVLNKELKVNASLVPLTLVVGMYGHLSLLLTLQQYATFSEEGFTSPTNPGPFTPPQKRYWSPDQSSTWDMAQVSMHIPYVPSCWKSTYHPSGSSGGITLSGCHSEHKHKPLWDSILNYYNIYWQHTDT